MMFIRLMMRVGLVLMMTVQSCHEPEALPFIMHGEVHIFSLMIYIFVYIALRTA